MRRPGFVSPLSVAVAAAVVVVVVVVTWLAGGILFSPGPLSAQTSGHPAINGVASHADLSGNCGACHPAPWAGDRMSDRCLACHTDVTAQLTSSTGVHGVVSSRDDDCRSCHSDHLGTAGVLTRFNGDAALHDRTRFSLAQHTKQADGSPFACGACHAAGYATLDQAVCVTCHTGLNASFMAQHQTAYGTDCIGCHDGKTHLAAIDHATTAFPLVGKHVGVTCSSCHVGPSLAAASPTCAACHAKDDAHKGGFGSDCGACHKATGWTDATVDHSKTAFPLDGMHTSVTCTKCHVNNVFKGTPTTCAACHQAPATHVGTAFAAGCASCHATSGWKPATLASHTFPINHGGTTSACAVCHPADYSAYTCYGCHAHTPSGILASHRGEGITDVTNCVKCHATGSGGG